MRCTDPPTCAVSPIVLIQSGWSLVYCTVPTDYSLPLSLYISHTEMLFAYILSLLSSSLLVYASKDDIHQHQLVLREIESYALVMD